MPIPAIEAAALRDVMRQVSAEMPGAPATPLRVGEVIAGKVMLMPDGQRGLSIGGVLIPATLPGELPLGEPMKLQVTQSSENRLVLALIKNDAVVDTGQATSAAQPVQQTQNDPTAASAMPPPYATIPMPGGAQARMWLDPDGEGAGAEDLRGGKERARTMVVRYDSPAIGRVDVVLRLEPEKLEAAVLAQAGQPIAQVRAAVPALRAALAAATDRAVALSTGGRAAEAVNVRA